MSDDERSGNYYENQFGNRIRDFGKGGSSTPPAGKKPDAGGGGKLGARGGGWLAVVVIIGVVRLVSSLSSSSSRSNNSIPPPLPQIQPMPQFVLNPPPAFPPAFDAQLPKDAPALTAEDVAYLPALCYRLHMEGRRADRTPARRIYDRLDEGARTLLREIALNADVEPAHEQYVVMLEAINELLDDIDFYDARYFPEPVKDAGTRLLLLSRPKPGMPLTDVQIRGLNRALMTAAFPRQIIARKQQVMLDGQRRLATEQDAKIELAELRRKYAAEKP